MTAKLLFRQPSPQRFRIEMSTFQTSKSNSTHQGGRTPNLLGLLLKRIGCKPGRKYLQDDMWTSGRVAHTSHDTVALPVKVLMAEKEHAKLVSKIAMQVARNATLEIKVS